ncbi:helix-turn-helix transcriptional regulator [Christiangramia forsetii]|uniref:AraC family transcriptional regulator protein n=2 Tax=Christiangramia forsetii TaxID=411153 RepID=A0M2P5_CHRFK|nr:AraC family transcriptional regulator [Christiangramia forsetii]GGG44212.1 AraC family transcriptional regulator [Christiangramia forsetii]CAL66890.1 AraC family transcriptional regulator protein [Christiangramia forsetii KT0803]
MNIISIKAITARDIFNELAKKFNTTCTESYGEYALSLPSEIGSGHISGINFPNGVGLFKFDLEFKSEYCLDFCAEEIQPFKFIYLILGNLQHQFSNEEITHFLDQGQSVILGANYKSGNKILFPGNKKIKTVILDVDRKKFVKQLTFPLDEMDKIYHELFADTNAIRTHYHHTEYSLKMAHLVEELYRFKSSGLERTSFNGAKALELLTYMLMLYKDDSQAEGRQILRSKDLGKIKNVVRLIDRNIAELDNISQIADNEGISEVKLQEGFQILFNCTVHEYILSRRLETAMQLLLKTDKSISEIVYAIGLNSRSHFSKIFKERYGVPPKNIRLNTKT